MRHALIPQIATGLTLAALAALALMPTGGTAFAQSSDGGSGAIMVMSQPASSSAAAVSPIEDPDLFVQQLRRREADLEIREQALRNQREAHQTILTEIEARIGELQSIRDEIELQLAQVDRERQARIDALALMYGGMDPSSAATQLATQEVGTIIDILLAMNSDAASIVLENFEPDDAAPVIEEMSRRQ